MSYKDKSKQREYARAWIARRRAAFFQDKVCVKCGATEQLELDHIDPSTKNSHSIWSWSEERRLAEIAKCQVLCYVCHKEKTARQQRENVKHGTSTMYDIGCRCEDCREAKRKKNAKRYISREGRV